VASEPVKVDTTVDVPIVEVIVAPSDVMTVTIGEVVRVVAGISVAPGTPATPEMVVKPV
jgi:hypothetical protein